MHRIDKEIIVAMDEAEVACGQSLAACMSACTPIERHLMEGKPLTDRTLALIST